MIQQKKVSNFNIIKVLNFENFQNDTTNDTTNDTIKNQKKKKIKKKNKKKKKIKKEYKELKKKRKTIKTSFSLFNQLGTLKPMVKTTRVYTIKKV